MRSTAALFLQFLVNVALDFGFPILASVPVANVEKRARTTLTLLTDGIALKIRTVGGSEQVQWYIDRIMPTLQKGSAHSTGLVHAL